MQTEPENKTNRFQQNIDGVVLGLLLSIDPQGQPLIAFPGNPEDTAIPARTTTQMRSEDVGCEVALMFEGGNPRLPLIIGKIQHAAVEKSSEENSPLAELDGESIVLSARQNITLKCGKASITLTKAGKVIVRGAYLLSRSSGVNRIKGGSVQIN